ncbi:MAG: hypothetical protein J6S67_09655 [Methanobrevibacter sp.]|nr:hypothetical protein [Methanobrevibacter sp.]
MKQGKRLSRAQKEVLQSHKLKADDWMFLDDCRDESGRPTSYFKIQHKTSGQIKIVDKFKRRK